MINRTQKHIIIFISILILNVYTKSPRAHTSDLNACSPYDLALKKRGIGKLYNLTFQAAIGFKKKSSVPNVKFEVIWNKMVVLTYMLTTQNIHKISLSVYGKKGQNSLVFKAVQVDNIQFGVAIDNVELIDPLLKTSHNYVINGNFIEVPSSSINNPQFSGNTVYNWTGKGYTIDTNMIYNTLWNSYYCYLQRVNAGQIGQIIDLQQQPKGEPIQSWSTTVTFSNDVIPYTVGFTYRVQPENMLQMSTISLLWNEQQFIYITPVNYQVNYISSVIYPVRFNGTTSVSNQDICVLKIQNSSFIQKTGSVITGIFLYKKDMKNIVFNSNLNKVSSRSSLGFNGVIGWVFDELTSYRERLHTFTQFFALKNKQLQYNYTYYQDNANITTNRYILIFQYGSSVYGSIATANLAIFWNKNQVGWINKVNDDQKHTVIVVVYAQDGANNLTFNGKYISTSSGANSIVIDNVQMFAQNGKQNKIINGGFQSFPDGDVSASYYNTYIGYNNINVERWIGYYYIINSQNGTTYQWKGPKSKTITLIHYSYWISQKVLLSIK